MSSLYSSLQQQQEVVTATVTVPADGVSSLLPTCLGGADAGQRASSGFGFYTEVPTDDVCRLSFYLKCCVLGCDITIGNDGWIYPLRQQPDDGGEQQRLRDQLLPKELFDYSNAHQLPISWKHLIFQLALHGFRLDKVLNNYVFVDDDHIVLSDELANMFLEVKSPHERATLTTLVHLQQQRRNQQVALPLWLPPPQLPSNGQKVMICSSEWLTEIYLEPCKRYQQSLMERALLSLRVPTSISSHSPAPSSCSDHSATERAVSAQAVAVTTVDGTTATTSQQEGLVHHPSIMCDHCGIPGIPSCRYRCTQCEDYDLCSTCYHHGQQDHEHTFECIECADSIPYTLPCIRIRRSPIDVDAMGISGEDKGKKGIASNGKESCITEKCSVQEEDIPMVDAIPITAAVDEIEEMMDVTSASSPQAAYDEESDHNSNYCVHSPNAESYIPGQVVRLSGLEGTDPALNDVLAVVEHRVQGNILVRIDSQLDSGWLVTVKPENLIVVGHVMNQVS